MQVWMMEQILTPGVEHCEETDLCSQVLWISGDSTQGLGGGPEENAVNDLFVLVGQSGNLLRHCKDNVEILAVEKLGLAALDPFGARQRLAAGAVAIGTGVIPDSPVVALLALLDMATESGGAA